MKRAVFILAILFALLLAAAPQLATADGEYDTALQLYYRGNYAEAVNAELITQVANQIFNAFGQLGVTVIPVVGGVALLSAFSLQSPLGGWLDDTFGIQLTFSTVVQLNRNWFATL